MVDDALAAFILAPYLFFPLSQFYGDCVTIEVLNLLSS